MDEPLLAAMTAESPAQQVQTQAESRVKMLLALNLASIAIIGELQLDAVLQRIVEVALELGGCRYAALGVLGDDGFISHFPTAGLSETEIEMIGAPPRGHGLLGVMLRAGRTLRISDINTDPRRVGFPPHHPPMGSLLGVPIFVRGKLVGDIYLTEKIGQAEFDEEDEWVVQLLATNAAIAISNAGLYEEVQRSREMAEREQERLRELEQMKDEFLSTAAHELRTPLTTIRMSAGLAYDQIRQLDENGVSIDARLINLVGLVVESSERMQSLVNDLLDLTRLEQGRTTLSSEDIDLREVVQAAAQSTRPLFDNKDQQLTIRVPKMRLPVRGDRRRLEQILINLLSNAHKYSPEGASVEMKAGRVGENLRVTVSDNGVGVPADEQERIFDRFYRSSLHRQDRTASTGLGLPIARTIAEMHRGKIWIEPAPNGGSIFILTLPRTASDYAKSTMLRGNIGSEALPGD